MGQSIGDDIQFADERREIHGRGVVQFYGERRGQRLCFRITKEALEAMTGEEPVGTCLDAFDRWRDQILSVAQDKADNAAPDGDGVYLIKQDDFPGG
jgi:hypothetical protein